MTAITRWVLSHRLIVVGIMLLVLTLVSLFGRWNRWLPQLPARVLRVEPSVTATSSPAEAA